LHQNGWFYKIAGSAAGAVLGFIIANIPGAIGGLVAGNRLGAIRDNHGKSVYEVYQGLDPETRNHILTQLAAKVLSGAFAS
jgi:diphthamide biosynthesis protein 4